MDIGKFIVTQADVQADVETGYWSLRSVTLRLDSNGPVDLDALADLMGVELTVRRTQKGISAYERRSVEDEA